MPFCQKKQDVQSFVALFCPQIKQKTSTAVTTPLWWVESPPTFNNEV